MYIDVLCFLHMLQVIPGHVDSPASSMWEELCFLKDCIDTMSKVKMDLAVVRLCKQYDDCKDLCDSICDILKNENYTRRPRLKEHKRNLDVEHLRDDNIMDDLWTILKSTLFVVCIYVH